MRSLLVHAQVMKALPRSPLRKLPSRTPALSSIGTAMEATSSQRASVRPSFMLSVRSAYAVEHCGDRGERRQDVAVDVLAGPDNGSG